MSLFSYPVLTPDDGRIFVIFLVAALAMPLGVLSIYALLNRFLPGGKSGGAPLKPHTLPKIFFALLLLAVVSPFIFLFASSAWKKITYSINVGYLNSVPEIIRQNTQYTNVKLCNNHYIAIVSTSEDSSTRKKNFLKICKTLDKEHFSKILAQHYVNIVIWDYEGCVKSFWDINKKNPKFFGGMCFDDGGHTISVGTSR